MVENVATGERGFAKFLTRNGDRRARHRFHREVAAYETLVDAPNLPHLIAHNGDRLNTREQLWLVLEPIDGVTLGQYITAQGPVDLGTALAMIIPLLDALAACHRENTLHRDVKPANVMLRGGVPTSPVLVDFGLSFNADTDLDDLTRVNEDIGNRFLHLPEQSFDRRTPLGDIAQAAGLLIYALTSIEPRVLVDDEGNMPHQRDGETQRLAAVANGQRLRALLTIFDTAFATRASSRFQSVDELRNAIDALRREPDAQVEHSLDELLARLNRTVNTASSRELADRQELLSFVAGAPARALEGIVSRYGLLRTQTGRSVDAAADPPTAQDTLALSLPGVTQTDPRQFVTYVYTLHGRDIVLNLDGLAGPVIWRGRDVNADDHNDAVRQVALERLMASDPPII